jgi:hypothetical protein
MSRLTPTKQATDFELQAALDIIANRTLTLEQAEELTRAITICDEESIWSPDIDDMADEFYSAAKAARRDDDRLQYELPGTPEVFSALDKLTIRGVKA